jgi:hypothetical protein
LRVRAGAEGRRSGADGWGRAVRQAGGQAVQLPLGPRLLRLRSPQGRGRGLGPVGNCGPALNTPRAAEARSAGARFAGRVGSSRCSKIARTPPGAVRDASTWRLPPHLTQANTSRANVLRSSPAWSSRGVRSFFGSSTFAAKDGLSSSGSGFAPACHSRQHFQSQAVYPGARYAEVRIYPEPQSPEADAAVHQRELSMRTVQEASPPPEAAAKVEAKKERTPRVDWAGLLSRAGSVGRLRSLHRRRRQQRVERGDEDLPLLGAELMGRIGPGPAAVPGIFNRVDMHPACVHSP